MYFFLKLKGTERTIFLAILKISKADVLNSRVLEMELGTLVKSPQRIVKLRLTLTRNQTKVVIKQNKTK
jgi:hypothetical protein